MHRNEGVLRAELRKVFGTNPWFWASLTAGMVFAVACSVRSAFIFNSTLELALKYWDTSDALYSATSCYSFWMLVDSAEWPAGIYVLVWPLLAALPYAWSWCAEKHSGLLAQQMARTSRLRCVAAKMLATFGGAVVSTALPLLVNLVICACIAPASPNWVSDVLYLGVTRDASLSSLFYNVPLAFCLLWTLVVALIAGLWADLVLALTMLLDNFAPTLVASYLVLHVLSYVGSQLSAIVLARTGSDVSRSALLSLDLFSTVSVRSQPDATAALLLAILLMAVVSLALARFSLSRDVL